MRTPSHTRYRATFELEIVTSSYLICQKGESDQHLYRICSVSKCGLTPSPSLMKLNLTSWLSWSPCSSMVNMVSMCLTLSAVSMSLILDLRIF